MDAKALTRRLTSRQLTNRTSQLFPAQASERSLSRDYSAFARNPRRRRHERMFIQPARGLFASDMKKHILSVITIAHTEVVEVFANTRGSLTVVNQA
jgi:hypothetical protein